MRRMGMAEAVMDKAAPRAWPSDSHPLPFFVPSVVAPTPARDIALNQGGGPCYSYPVHRREGVETNQVSPMARALSSLGKSPQWADL